MRRKPGADPGNPPRAPDISAMAPRTPAHALAPILSGLLLTACSVVGIRDGTETPPYQVTNRVGTIEIRQYGARIAAETSVQDDEVAARSDGFRRLAGYIFGANSGKQAIAMTAPVAQTAQPGPGQPIAMTAPVTQARDPGGAWSIRFFMPAQYTLGTLPTPNDAAIRLVPIPPEHYAVLRFSGSTSPGAVATRQAQLVQALVGSAWRPAGPALAWFYDPPWTLPFLRRNEVAVPVQPAA